ncbi:hypothetical protein FLONG3_3147 [Fusarium longipes]|uniref:Uncharacterized protein n=1 Tax=Fusarium longipes TaxID=694270 RepID=A0A395T2Z6_9HYPO|nr:hypothetical protein FLONG3_3147 [Fusarium longipes]
MAFTRPLLYVSIGLLMVVSIIELAFISVMVSWLHRVASGTFPFEWQGRTYDILGKPANMIGDQGHTSNGAAGTAFIVIGCGGILALFLRNRHNAGKFSRFFYNFWLVVNVLNLLLTIAALVYTFIVTTQHDGQSINPNLAARIDGAEKYPLESWTPQNWFPALLDLNLVDSSQRSDIELQLRIMRGWQYNLIPFVAIHLVETALALWDAKQRRNELVPAYEPAKHYV